MIGQSGLPMINNLAGSNEKTPEDAKAKTPAGEAGAFEKILLPNASEFAAATDPEAPADGQKGLSKTKQESSLTDAKTAENAAARTQIDSGQFVRSPLKAPADNETAARTDSVEQIIEPIATRSALIEHETITRQHPKANDQILASAPGNGGDELTSLNAEKPVTAPDPIPGGAKNQSEESSERPVPQTSEAAAKAAQPEILADTADRPNLTDRDRVRIANVPQDQPGTSLPLVEAGARELSDQQSKPVAEAKVFASSSDGPEFPAVSPGTRSQGEILRISEGGIRLSQGDSSLPTPSLPDRNSETIAASLGNGRANTGGTALKIENSETSIQLAATQPSEQKGQPPQSQAEIAQDPTRTLTPRSDSRAAVAWNGVATAADPATTSPASSASPADGAGLKAMVPTQAQATAPDTATRTPAGFATPTDLAGLREMVSTQAQATAPDPTTTSPASSPSSADGAGPKVIVSSPAPQALTMTRETSFSSQGVFGEQSEVSLGPFTTATSTTSSRLDAVAPLPATADAKLVMHQVNQAIIRMDGTRTEITLDPAELGRVSLTVITKDEGVTVLINAERSETADLLRRNGEQLQRDLSNAGYEGVELDFDEGDDAHPDPAERDKLDEISTARSTSVSYESNFITSGLDIRI